jgi:hypothetical protein
MQPGFNRIGALEDADRDLPSRPLYGVGSCQSDIKRTLRTRRRAAAVRCQDWIFAACGAYSARMVNAIFAHRSGHGFRKVDIVRPSQFVHRICRITAATENLRRTH